MAVSPRSEMRQDDARENLREEPARLTRRRGLHTDKYHVPDDLKQPDMSYEWKTATVTGMEQMEHQVELAANHWKPVLASEMPGMMPADYKGHVNRGGQVLMCRPEYLTQEAHEEILDTSLQRVKNQEQRLGMSNRDEAPRTAPKVSRAYSPVTRSDKASVRVIPE
ncbi:hypothetical protein ACELLULO517_07735 [Acidisoma cellulosilytica]|uniref:Uncharacterized protein n=1 Tax=Acidisoma cellulosilyticum TaxID=2802395 RepID=A0A963Z179_9PROT|nr:hypothetical protein [Acidisoma cellulosilyticum]MCB8880122.1 hypothetical protein [Acidisoma cellulosilyticum]